MGVWVVLGSARAWAASTREAAFPAAWPTWRGSKVCVHGRYPRVDSAACVRCRRRYLTCARPPHCPRAAQQQARQQSKQARIHATASGRSQRASELSTHTASGFILSKRVINTWQSGSAASKQASECSSPHERGKRSSLQASKLSPLHSGSAASTFIARQQAVVAVRPINRQAGDCCRKLASVFRAHARVHASKRLQDDDSLRGRRCDDPPLDQSKRLPCHQLRRGATVAADAVGSRAAWPNGAGRRVTGGVPQSERRLTASRHACGAGQLVWPAAGRVCRRSLCAVGLRADQSPRPSPSPTSRRTDEP